jgi:energy-converting hydrogenase Eha subunit G
MVSILPLLAEGSEVMHVKWENLSMVQGQTVRIFLPGGFISGKASTVEADALVVDVRKTSDPKTYPKGMLRVPREKLHRLEMQTKGKTGRILLTSLGTIVTGFTGYAVAEYGIDQC